MVPLTPKAFAVLDHLITEAGRLVTKDELLDVAWPDVHVGDAALKVLSWSPSRPRCPR
jgi:adenylate cyclase